MNLLRNINSSQKGKLVIGHSFRSSYFRFAAAHFRIGFLKFFIISGSKYGKSNKNIQFWLSLLSVKKSVNSGSIKLLRLKNVFVVEVKSIAFELTSFMMR